MEPLYALLGVFALLMLISLLSSKLSGIINMPCLLLFLAVGLAAGSDLLDVFESLDVLGSFLDLNDITGFYQV